MTKFTTLLALLCLLGSSALASIETPPEAFARSPGHPGTQEHSYGRDFEARKHSHHHQHHHNHSPPPAPQQQHEQSNGQSGQEKHGAKASNKGTNTVHWGDDPEDWKLVVKIDHTNFYDEMDTFTGPDPTKGIVNYVSMAQARQEGLVNTDNGKIFMGISKNRKNGMFHAVRPNTKKTFTEGIITVKVNHMPAACGNWPAIFTVAADGSWPDHGEIDIVEGVHFYKSNKMSIHTLPGCHLQDWALNLQLGNLGSESSTNCAALQTDDKGCAIQSEELDYGVAVNNNGLGLYAMAWDEEHGISVYYFKQVPADIAAGKPDPTKWGKPTAYFPAQGCNPSQFFHSHSLVFTNTLGGQWAGNEQVWNWKATMEQSCAEKTGAGSFMDYVNSGKADFGDAYWLIEDIQIWQKRRKA
ncbi:hypothetical protein CF319_g4015 [Tilletia indica]|nr:hypothetical protein CF319_g4015 [Tilletia indica]